MKPNLAEGVDAPEAKLGILFRMNTGHIVKSKHTKQFVTLSNEFARNPKISLKAKGLLLALISLPHDWVVNKKQLSEYFSDGYDAINSAFKELEKLGYIVGVQVFNGSRFAGWNYVVYDEPVTADNDKLPNRGFPDTGIPNTENPNLQRKDYTKKENIDTHTLAPILEQVITEFANLGIPQKQAEKFYHKYSAIGWVDKNKIPIVNWLAFAKASWIPRIKAIDKQNEVKDKNPQGKQQNGLVM